MKLALIPQGLAASLLALAAVLVATAALAHAQLRQAVPAVGGTATAAPKALTLRFSEGIEPRFSTVTLATEAGTPVVLGRAATDPSDDAVLTLSIGQALKPGAYVVTWHVVSVDTHKTQGSFRFTVAP